MAGRQEIKKEQGEFDGNTKAAFGMFGVAMGATVAGLLDDNENSDRSGFQKIKDNLTQARNNVVTGADKSQASLNAHVDAITDGDLTDALQNQAILNELNAQLTQGTHANGSSVYLTQGTVNDQGQEVKGQANVDRGHTYLNIDYIDTTLETLNHEIAHHNGLGETSATAMGKISDFAYNIGTSLNTDDINTHRQTITPTEKTLQNLSSEEQLTITQDNQALLNANEVQRAWEVESGDGVWNYTPPGVNGEACTGAECSDRQIIAQINACKRDASQCRDYPEHLKIAASILVPTSPEEVAFIVVTAGGGYVLKVAGKAGVKVVRSFKGKDELDKAVAEAKRVRYNNPQTHREDLARQAGIPRDIINNPASIWGKTTDQIKQSLEMDGAVVTKNPAKRGTSGNGHVYEVKGGSSGIKEFEYHAGGGVHGASYYKIVKNDGTIVKIIEQNGSYKPGTITQNQIYLNPQGQRLRYEGGKWTIWK